MKTEHEAFDTLYEAYLTATRSMTPSQRWVVASKLSRHMAEVADQEAREAWTATGDYDKEVMFYESKSNGGRETLTDEGV